MNLPRVGWFSVLSTLLCVSSLPAFGDAITPDTFTGNIPSVGGTISVAKTVTVTQQLSSALDIMFLVDTTGSMSSSISSVSSGFSSIVSSIAAIAPNVAFGLGEYKDVGDAFVYQRDANIGSTNAQVQTALAALSAGGGGDTPEGGLYGLAQVASTTSWRPGSQRFVIWVGDAPGHDPSGPTNVTEAAAIAALTGANINVFAASATSGPGLDAACGSAPGPPSNGCLANQAQRIATGTSGSDLGTFNGAAIATAIQNAIVTSLNTYSVVSLAASGLPAGIGLNITPGSISGSFDRSITRTFNFNVTFTGNAPGTYDFSINALLDGRTIATENDHITVGGVSSVPEPSTLVMISAAFGLLLLGRRARK